MRSLIQLCVAVELLNLFLLMKLLRIFLINYTLMLIILTLTNSFIFWSYVYNLKDHTFCQRNYIIKFR